MSSTNDPTSPHSKKQKSDQSESKNSLSKAQDCDEHKYDVMNIKYKTSRRYKITRNPQE